jgi:hypothetical protein
VTASGFPDDQGYANWHGTVLVDNSASIPGAGETFGPFLVDSFAAIKLQTANAGGTCEVAVNYYADEAGDTQLGAYVLWVTNQTDLNVLIPADAAWLQVTVTPQSGDATMLDLTVAPSNVATPKIAYLGYGSTIATGSVSLPEAEDIFYYPAFVCPGPCAIYFGPEDDDAMLTLELEAQSGIGIGTGDLWRVTKPADEVQLTCQLPDFPVEFKVSNADAANAHAFRLGATPWLL